MSVKRHSSGTSRGGQFAEIPHPESGIALPVNGSHGTFSRRAQLIAELADSWVATRADDDPELFTEFVCGVPHLSPERHESEWRWLRVCAQMADRYSSPDVSPEDIDDAVEHPVLNLGVNIEDYAGTDGPDRPGETDNAGYVHQAFASAVATAWREQLDIRAAQVVAADREAAERFPARALS